MPQFLIKKLEDWFLNLTVEIADEVYVSSHKSLIPKIFWVILSFGFVFHSNISRILFMQSF